MITESELKWRLWTEEPEPEEKPELDLDDLLDNLPDIDREIEPMRDWQRHFRELDLLKRIASAMQKITNVKTQKLGTDNTAHTLPDEDVNIEELNESITEHYAQKTVAELAAELHTELLNEPHHALVGCFKMETAEEVLRLMQALEWIIRERFGIAGLAGLASAEETQLRKLHFSLPQILEEFRRADILLGILGETNGITL